MDILIERLREYYYVNMDTKQYEEAFSLINNDSRLLYYLCYSYNCCEVLHNEGRLAMITNPDALFKSPESEKAFLIDFKTFLRKALDIGEGDVQNGRFENNNSRQTFTEN